MDPPDRGPGWRRVQLQAWFCSSSVRGPDVFLHGAGGIGGPLLDLPGAVPGRGLHVLDDLLAGLLELVLQRL